MNMTLAERVLRSVAGILLLCLLLRGSGAWQWLGPLGLLPLVTGLTGRCPIYAWFLQD